MSFASLGFKKITRSLDFLHNQPEKRRSLHSDTLSFLHRTTINILRRILFLYFNPYTSLIIILMFYTSSGIYTHYTDSPENLNFRSLLSFFLQLLRFYFFFFYFFFFNCARARTIYQVPRPVLLDPSRKIAPSSIPPLGVLKGHNSNRVCIYIPQPRALERQPRESKNYGRSERIKGSL